MPTPTTGSTFSLFSPTGNVKLDALLDGTRWGPVELGGNLIVSYSFPNSNDPLYWSTDPDSGYGSPSGDEEPWNDFHVLNADQRGHARDVFSMINAFTKLNLVEVSESTSSVGDIRLAFSGRASGSAAYAYLPGGVTYDDNQEGEAAPYAGDVWINYGGGTFNPTTGSDDYHTLIHELGHALGLKHTFETDGGYNAIDPAHDSYKYSVMSYSAIPGNEDSGMSYYPTTLMSYDVYALQYLYGKNTTYHAGNDIYRFSATGDYNQVIWDAGGVDTIVYSSTSGGCSINLVAGSWQELGKPLNYYDYVDSDNDYTSSETVQILVGVTIENATGGDGADLLKGNSVANFLQGSGGNDTISGAAGNDTLNGGAGADSMTGGDGSDTYFVSNSLDKVIETNATASNGGIDLVVSYLTSCTLGANVEYGRVGASGTAGLTGNLLDNRLYAGHGNNSLNGGSGIDTVSYAYAAGSITVSLSRTDAQATGGSGTDTIANCENLNGGAYADTLTGNAAANRLYGAAGNDTLAGGAGNDVLTGAAGCDRLIGGDGNDIFDFNALGELGYGSTRDVIESFVRGADRIDLSSIDAKPTQAGDQAFSLVSAFSGSDATGQMVYAGGVVSLSTDSDSAAEYQIQLVGTVPTTLAASDFIL